MRFFFFGLCVFGAALPLAATPVDDLASPSQTTRDAAARVLRRAGKTSPPAELQEVLDKFRLGERGTSEDGVLWRLRAFHPKPTISISSGFTRTGNYELDGGWLLHCAFGAPPPDRFTESAPSATIVSNCSLTDWGNYELFAYNLYRSFKPVEIEPPPGFTGRWLTYYTNGRKSSDCRYAHGKRIKETKYDDDGKPAGRAKKPPSDDPMLRLGG